MNINSFHVLKQGLGIIGKLGQIVFLIDILLYTLQSFTQLQN